MAAVPMRLRDLLPWRAFTIETSWSPRVVAVELKKRIDERRLVATPGDAPFVGTTSADGKTFRFWRALAARGSAAPTTMVILAVVEPSHHDGARVRVRMRPGAVALLMGAVGGAGALLVAGLGLWLLVRGDATGLAFLAFPLLGAAGASAVLALEARRAERTLRQIYAQAPGLPAPPDTRDAYR